MKKITVAGYWNDNNEIFIRHCMVGEWDGNEDDNDIFYYFEPDEKIIGEHMEFTITKIITEHEQADLPFA